MTHVIHAQGLEKSLSGKCILKGIDLTVAPRSITALLGNNGAGKSTLFKILTGLISADAGEVEILGENIRHGFPALHSRLGALVDAPTFYPNLTAREFLSIACRLKQQPSSEIDRVLHIVGLEQAKYQLIKRFSLGMKQRLALAFALIGKPKLLLLDEPTNGLDPQGMLEMRELLTTLPTTTDCSIFVSSHLLDEVEKIASHVALLDEGVIKVQAEMKDIHHDLARSYMLEVSSPAQILSHLLKLGLQAQVLEHGTIRIDDIGQQQASAVLSHCIKEGLSVYQAYWHQMSLEQWFLHTCNHKVSTSGSEFSLEERPDAVA